MRLFGGLSFPVAKGVRAGISRRGTPWFGARGGSGPLYLGALFSPKRRGRRREAERAGNVVLGEVLGIQAERTVGYGSVLLVEFAEGNLRIELSAQATEELLSDLDSVV